jgi:hypothetical protein
VTNDTVINNEMESGHVLIFGYITAFAWSDWRKPRKPSIVIDGLWAEIWTRDLPNTKQECQPTSRLRRLVLGLEAEICEKY